MTNVIKCDYCGDTVHEQHAEYYRVSRSGETDNGGFHASGDFCPDCFPDEFGALLSEEVWGHE